MKLVAKQDFFNSPGLNIVLGKDEKLKHENLIHKGLRFSMGKAEHFKDLGPVDQEAVGTLLKRGLVVFDNKENADTGVIDTIDKEVAAANKLAAEAPKSKSQAEEIAAAVIQALVAAGVVQPAKKST